MAIDQKMLIAMQPRSRLYTVYQITLPFLQIAQLIAYCYVCLSSVQFCLL